MDELEISGRRYISSRLAAKEQGYHADYIGQLVRGKKVAGQKVGRAWYVDAQSLKEYLGKEVPPRGPMPKSEPIEIYEAPAAKVVKEETLEEEYEPVTVHSAPQQQTFGRNSREHVIEAIPEYRPKPAPKVTAHAMYQEAEEDPIVVQKVEYVHEVKRIEPVPHIEAAHDEEESYVPVKISHERKVEPEDSFYKISRSGLRYKNGSRPNIPEIKSKAQSDTEEEVYEAPRVVESRIQPTVVRSKKSFSTARLMAYVGAVLFAGALSLTVLGGFSYYLHSVVTVEGEGQTSSILLSE